MFRIPKYFVETPSMHEAVSTMTRHGRGDLFEGMLAMERVWTEHCATPDASDSAFFDNWIFEVNAFNKVFTEMSELF
jgi:hypothetical protein